VFLDIFPILRDPVAFETLITNFVYRLTSHTIPNSPTKKIDVVVGPDARGFILGPILALRLGAAFVPVRKRGKLPGKCISAVYEKEYGAVQSVPLRVRCMHAHMKCRMFSRCKRTRSSQDRM
jgi:adenine phosphoribosyltransferase